MNEKLRLLIGISGFFLIILVSSLLYRYLGSHYAPESSNRLSATETDTRQTSPPPNSSAPSPSKEPEIIKAPDFTVTDRNGNTVKFSDLSGKPIVINFWASWCPPCKSEMPEFDNVYRELGEEIIFLMINATDGSRETVETAAAYIDGQDYSFPIYFDTSQEASYVYGISSLPTTVFIDKDKNLVTGAIGMIDEATLRRGIDMITQ